MHKDVPLTRDERDAIQREPFITAQKAGVITLDRYESTVQDLEALIRHLERSFVASAKESEARLERIHALEEFVDHVAAFSSDGAISATAYGLLR